jgi:hypothetical protein
MIADDGGCGGGSSSSCCCSATLVRFFRPIIYNTILFGRGGVRIIIDDLCHSQARSLRYYIFQINCTFLPKSEIFYTPDVKNLCSM